MVQETKVEWGLTPNNNYYLQKNCQHISQRADSKYENSIFNIANNGDFTPRYPYNPASHDGGRGNI